MKIATPLAFLAAASALALGAAQQQPTNTNLRQGQQQGRGGCIECVGRVIVCGP